MSRKIPQLDLHPYSLSAAKSALRSFLVKAMRQGTKSVKIIHGLGNGYLEEVTVEVLSEFGFSAADYDYEPFNCGATIVELGAENPQGQESWKYKFSN